MGSSSPSLKCRLSCLLDPQQQRKRQSTFCGNLVKIQKVPLYLRQRSEFDKYYLPKVISIGPIHHPKGEAYKEMWATMYLQDKVRGQQENAQKILDKIRHEMQALKDYYAEDVIQCLDDDDLAWILFIDGCAALHIMDKTMAESPKLQALDIIVQQDLMLLENQLPYKVLKILLTHGDDSVLRRFVNCFLQSHVINVLPQSQAVIDEPVHLLDLLIITSMANQEAIITIPPKGAKSPTHRNIQELKATAGIKIEKNEGRNLASIYFRCRTLYIPPFTVDDFTAQTFLNMIAYEMCPDNSKTNYEVSNYVSFLNSLIDHADDVKALRKARVLTNHLGSDEEVAELFNTVSTDLVLDTGTYNPVRRDIEKFYKHRLWIWLHELQYQSFNTPWKFIGLISAILGFILTIATLKKELGPEKNQPRL